MGRTLFAGIGRSRTSSTTRATSRYVKTHRESAKTPASSPECAASPTISCGIINPTSSHRTAMLQLSVASIRSFQCASVKSVEQPWGAAPHAEPRHEKHHLESRHGGPGEPGRRFLGYQGAKKHTLQRAAE